jgi:glycosyltransferase involved in cell wall biosynthesis
VNAPAPLPTVTVPVPTFNRRFLLRQAIDSLLAQTQLPHQLLVLDDCSTDGTAVADLEAATNTPATPMTSVEIDLLDRLLFHRPYYERRSLIERPREYGRVRRILLAHGPFRAGVQAIAARRSLDLLRDRERVAPWTTLRLLAASL